MTFSMTEQDKGDLLIQVTACTCLIVVLFCLLIYLIYAF